MSKGFTHIPTLILLLGIAIFLLILFSSLDKEALQKLYGQNESSIQGINFQKDNFSP